jgi:hypothetical protein
MIRTPGHEFWDHNEVRDGKEKPEFLWINIEKSLLFRSIESANEMINKTIVSGWCWAEFQ